MVVAVRCRLPAHKGGAPQGHEVHLAGTSRAHRSKEDLRDRKQGRNKWAEWWHLCTQGGKEIFLKTYRRKEKCRQRKRWNKRHQKKEGRMKNKQKDKGKRIFSPCHSSHKGTWVSGLSCAWRPRPGVLSPRSGSLWPSHPSPWSGLT